MGFNMRDCNVELSKDERDLIYNQLSARYMDFEEMMKTAMERKNTDRVIEIVDVLKQLKVIMGKMLK